MFGDRAALGSGKFAADIVAQWPHAARIGCSTAGQIQGTEVFDEGAVATAVKFDHTKVRVATTPVTVPPTVRPPAPRSPSNSRRLISCTS